MARTKTSLKNSDFFGPRQALKVWHAAKLAKRPFFEIRGMPLTYPQTTEALFCVDHDLYYPYELADSTIKPFWAHFWETYPHAPELDKLTEDEWHILRSQWYKHHIYTPFNCLEYFKDDLTHGWIDPSGQIGMTGNFSDKYPAFIHSTLKEIKEKLPFLKMAISIYNAEGKPFLTAQIDKDVRYTLAHQEVMSLYPRPIQNLFVNSFAEEPAPWTVSPGQALPPLMVQELYQKTYAEIDSALVRMEKIALPSFQSGIPTLD